MKKKYLEAKVREFEGEIRTDILDKGTRKENMYYTCIACITIDSVVKINKKIIHKFIQKNVSRKLKKIQMSRFINNELESDSSDSDLE